MLGKKKRLSENEDDDKIVHISENVDRKGIFYSIKRMPEKLHKKFNWAYDKKNDDWMIEEGELRKVKKILKRRGYKIKIAKMNQVVMSLRDALKEFDEEKLPRLKSKYKSLDELVGGGFVKGGTVLVSGEPGAGKSTLATQLMLKWSKKRRCIYINTEETIRQVTDRFKRINENQKFNKKQRKNLLIVIQKDINLVRATLKKEDAEVLILDSLGGFSESSSNLGRGGSRILKEATAIVYDYVKENRPDAVAIMTGHVTKKGEIAGPESIQHMADVTLFIQGSGQTRSIQPLKNRYGPTSGMIHVGMGELGLEFEDSQEMRRDVRPGQSIARADSGWDRLD